MAWWRMAGAWWRMAGGCGHLGAPDGYLVACVGARGGSIKTNANLGAVRLPGRPPLKASRTHPGGMSEKPQNAFRRGAVAILAMSPGAQMSNSCSVFHHDACIMKKKIELSLEFWPPEGEIEKEKKGVWLDSGGHFFKSERFVEAKCSFFIHD